ncbi:HDIG domain-containing protein [bacterium]|nr:HDIG domain-containing protein [bacterium]MBD5398516.1 HDIG domain-containing protein [bacterium]
MLPTDKQVEELFTEATQLCKNNNITLGWINHSYYVANIASSIAKKLNMDERYAYLGGLFHDIGRCLEINSEFGVHFHEIEGFKLLTSKGYTELARFCITHGFIDKLDIKENSYLFNGINKDDKHFYFDFINNLSINEYDRLVELADNLAVKEGYVTLEQRLVDLMKRHKYGTVNYWLSKFDEVAKLKEYFDEKLGMSVYAVVPNFINESLKFKYSN